jgi:hypothetical protein
MSSDSPETNSANGTSNNADVPAIVSKTASSFRTGIEGGTQDSKPELPQLGDRLTEEQVVAFAELALKNIQTEYPNKPGNVVVDPASVRTPKRMHPAFYGCFDWHSSVHGHWMLVRLLKDYPDNPLAAKIREKLDQNLSSENLAGELSYFNEEQHKTFERTYGWAWYLRLVAELHSWEDPQGKQWRENLRGLEELLIKRSLDYLPKLSFPIRTGIHPDTGFALAQILDYARVVGQVELEKIVVDRARDYYLADVSYPARYEPSGQDFFSTGLNEADLMRRVLSPPEFVAWFDMFLPGLRNGNGGNLLEPVEVSDVTDGYIVHLAGLDLSRAWCMEGIASVLPDDDPRVSLLRSSAREHAKTGFGYVFSGHYEGEHWLATFAVYLQSGVGIPATTKQTVETDAKTEPAALNQPLNVLTSAMTSEIQMLGSSDANAELPGESKIEIIIENESEQKVVDIDVTLRLDAGIRLTRFDYGETKLGLVNRNDSFTRFDVKRCTELAAGEKLRFVATVIGAQVGESSFQVSVQFGQSNQPPQTSAESILVRR